MSCEDDGGKWAEGRSQFTACAQLPHEVAGGGDVGVADDGVRRAGAEVGSYCG